MYIHGDDYTFRLCKYKCVSVYMDMDVEVGVNFRFLCRIQHVIYTDLMSFFMGKVERIFFTQRWKM